MALLARLSAFGGRGEAAKAAADAPQGDELRVTMLLTAQTGDELDVAALSDDTAAVQLFAGGLEALSVNGPVLRRSDVVIVEVDPTDVAQLDALEQFATTSGARIPVVAAARDLTLAAARRLMRSSIADVLPIPFTKEEWSQALESARAKLSVVRTGGGPARSGNIIALQGALGGIGTSMIATQLAQVWSENKKVLLIDLDIQRGNTALYLNLKPRLSIADLVEADERLDVEFLNMVAERHQSGVSVIAAPNDMTPMDAVTPEFIDRLLDLATQNYDLVILDLPGVWMDWSALAIQKSDLMLLVTQLSVSGIQQARRQLDVAEANSLSDRVRVIMNRMTPGLFGKYDLGEAETALRARVHAAVADDYPTVAAALDEGRALKQIKLKSRVEKDLKALATQLSEELLTLGATA